MSKSTTRVALFVVSWGLGAIAAVLAVSYPKMRLPLMGGSAIGSVALAVVSMHSDQ